MPPTKRPSKRNLTGPASGRLSWPTAAPPPDHRPQAAYPPGPGRAFQSQATPLPDCRPQAASPPVRAFRPQAAPPPDRRPQAASPPVRVSRPQAAPPPDRQPQAASPPVRVFRPQAAPPPDRWPQALAAPPPTSQPQAHRQALAAPLSLPAPNFCPLAIPLAGLPADAPSTTQARRRRHREVSTDHLSDGDSDILAEQPSSRRRTGLGQILAEDYRDPILDLIPDATQIQVADQTQFEEDSESENAEEFTPVALIDEESLGQLFQNEGEAAEQFPEYFDEADIDDSEHNFNS